MSSLAATEEHTHNTIQTRFGAFAVATPHILTFADGIPGFEGCQRFALIAADELTPLSCLQGLDAPCPSFLAADPVKLKPDYRPILSEPDRRALGLAEGDTVTLLVLLTIGLREVTANLRAPVVINPRTRVGRQVLLEDQSLPVSWRVETR